MRVQDWFETELEPKFSAMGITITDPARRLIKAALHAQIEEGLVANEDQLLQSLARMPLEHIPLLYLTKYGSKVMTFNRAVRLLADMHERWVTLRHLPSEQPRNGLGSPEIATRPAARDG